MTWLAEVDQAPFVPVVCVHYDNLISKGVLDKNEDFKDFINKNSKVCNIILSQVGSDFSWRVAYPLLCLFVYLLVERVHVDWGE